MHKGWNFKLKYPIEYFTSCYEQDRTGQKTQCDTNPNTRKAGSSYNRQTAYFGQRIFQDQPKVTLTFKTQLMTTYWQTIYRRELNKSIWYAKYSFGTRKNWQLKRRLHLFFNQFFNSGQIDSATTGCFKQTMVLYIPLLHRQQSFYSTVFS